MNRFFSFLISVMLLYSCSPAVQISKTARKTLLSDSALRTAHIGISIFEPASNKYWYSYQAQKYFVPASNVKIASCYAAMKYLGDSLKGIEYDDRGSLIVVEATGDPTFMHPAFPNQPVAELLKKSQHILINTENWKDKSLGMGWSWDDYNSAYTAEKSPMPVYGNLVHWEKTANANTADSGSVVAQAGLKAIPSFFNDSLYLSNEIGRITDAFDLQRNRANNQFMLTPVDQIFQKRDIPFITNGFETTRRLLRDSLKKDVRSSFYTLEQRKIIYTQPTDSVLKIMMHQSDNFMAEQSLLMVSDERLQMMNTANIITLLLHNDLKDLPQRPRWVDGSGLSRYNLFTPQDFVFLLNRMKNEFGIDRMKEILPGSNEGTLKNYYVADSSAIYAKTGTLSGVVALSGYLYTKTNKLLIFSVLVNNHQATATDVRRAVEKFLQGIRNRY